MKCDIIHVHGCSYWGFLPIVVAVFLGVFFHKKIIITYHGGEAKDFFENNKIIINLFLKRANKILVPSSFLRNIFRNYGFETIIYPNLIKTNEMKYIDRKEIRPFITIVKHLEDIYDIGTAIKAFSIVKIQYPMAKLRIVGSGSKEKQLRSLVEKMNLYDVEFMGQIKHENINEIYASNDILLNTSLVESFGMVILEGFAFGMIVISTNVGGIPDLLKNNENGFLVNPGDYREFAEKIILILRNPELAHEISLKARQSAYNYDCENNSLKLLSIYKEVLMQDYN